MLSLGVTTPGSGASSRSTVSRRAIAVLWAVVRVGVAKEIKTDEYRVALTPAGARELIQRGHEVVVETTAGEGSAFPDDQYERAGARIVSVDDAWGRADLVLKVKEPKKAEYLRAR